MACFIVPAVEAIIVSVAKRRIRQEELAGKTCKDTGSGLLMSRKLGWLNGLLWGGSLLLAVEHVWHGEVVLWPPFLTAMKTPEEIPVMLGEMATVGVGMAVFVTLVWGAACLIAEHKVRRFVPTSNLSITEGA